MNTIRAAVGLLALCCVPAMAAPLTVVGFNIDSGGASDHVISLQLKESLGVDLWGLGDVWDSGDWLRRLREGAQSGENSEFGQVLGETGGDSRLLVLYRQSRLERVGQEEILAARASSRQAAPLAVRFRLDGGEEFYFLVANLVGNDERRSDQARAIAAWAELLDAPIIAVGTFNFGVADDGAGGDKALELLKAAGWKWARPETLVGTSCDSRGFVQDYVLLAGGASEWGYRAATMYPQSNYCPDDERTSGHRPVLANLETSGRGVVVTGSMPARQVSPFFPGQAEMSFGSTELASEPRLVSPTPPPAGQAAPEGMPSAESIYPVPQTDAGDPRPTASGESATVGDDRSKEQMLRRLEALEEEMRELRKALQEEE